MSNLPDELPCRSFLGSLMAQTDARSLRLCAHHSAAPKARALLGVVAA
jgi:hypothetical protein